MSLQAPGPDVRLVRTHGPPLRRLFVSFVSFAIPKTHWQSCRR